MFSSKKNPAAVKYSQTTITRAKTASVSPTSNSAIIPAKVDRNDLTSHNRLLTDTEFNALVKFLRHKPDGRYSKKILGKNYGVIKLENEYYVVYKGKKHHKELGTGGFGKVKLVQHHVTGTWYALKIGKATTNDMRNEHKIVKDLGLAVGPCFKRQETNKSLFSCGASQSKNQFLMRFYEGNKLSSFLYANPKYSTLEWITVIIHTIQAVQRIHQKGYLHRDINAANFILDASNLNVDIIDFGFTKKADKKFQFKSELRLGTPEYIAPELMKQAKKPFIYNMATEVYALGETITRISTPTELNLITEMLDRMRDPNPAKRPSLDVALQFFQQIQHTQALLNVDHHPLHQRR